MWTTRFFQDANSFVVVIIIIEVILIATLAILVFRLAKAQVPFLAEGLRRALHVVANPFPQVCSALLHLVKLFAYELQNSPDVTKANEANLGIHSIDIVFLGF